MKVTIEIECDNSAFENGNEANELSIILGRLSRQLEMVTNIDGVNHRLYDSNGNRVGEMRVSE